MLSFERRVRAGALAAALASAGLLTYGSLAHSGDSGVDTAAERIVVTNLFDNVRTDTRLTARWGFAALIERGGSQLLFDTGADGSVLLANMAILSVDPQRIDAVMISHAHSDHIGGLDRLLQENDGVKVFLPGGVPEPTRRRITARGTEYRVLDAPAEIFPGMHTTGTLGAGVREQALVLETSEGLVVVTGCAHPGIVDIVRRAKAVDTDAPVALVMGGMHLREASDRQIDTIISGLKALGVRKVAPSHCTGDRAVERFRLAYGAGFIRAGAGMRVNFELPDE